MKQKVSRKDRRLNGKVPIILLTVLFFFTAFFCLSMNIYKYIQHELSAYYSEFLFFLPWSLKVICSCLFLFYLLLCYKKSRLSALPAFILGLVAVYLFFDSVTFMDNKIRGVNIYFVYIIIFLIIAICGALKGFPRKFLLVIPMVLGILNEIVIICNFIRYMDIYMDFGDEYVIYLQIIDGIGVIAFYIAMMTFVLNNRVPVVLPGKVKTEYMNKLSAEKALFFLEDKHDMGQISDQEYTAHRLEIINRL